jgi:outer membrane protein assembly factor BamB
VRSRSRWRLGIARRVAVGATIALVAAACSSSGKSGPATDWPTWGFGVERQGFNPKESSIGVGNVDELKQSWSVDLGANINTAAVVATGVRVGGRSRDLAYVGTEHGAFYAIDVADGRIVWKKQYATQTVDCSESPDNIFGVTAAALIDKPAKRVYVAAADGKLHGLDLATGAEVRGWPVTLVDDPKTDFVWSAPTLWKGRLYVGTASHCEVGPREGRIIAIATATAQKLHVFWISDEGPPTGGSIWGWGGVSVDPESGDVFAVTGNAMNFPENVLYADHVLRLTRDLQLVASHAPPVVGFDDDFGSSPMLFQRKGCPPQLATMRKHGALYLYDRNGITNGPRQTVNVSGPPFRLAGVSAIWPEENLIFVANPTPPTSENYTHGMLAFKITEACRLDLAWQQTAGRNDSSVSSPTVANGVVYYGDGMGEQLHAFDARTGHPLWSSKPGDIRGPVFVAPVVVNGMVLAGAWDGRLHAWTR